MIINNRTELHAHVCGLDYPLEKAIYKGTNCGAWISHDDTSVTVGSIVEGSDIDCDSWTLEYPFESDLFWAALDKVEKEAEYIWNFVNNPENDDLELEPFWV